MNGLTSFDKWMREVDALCWENWGVGIYDLPDMRFRDFFEDGRTPLEFFHDELGTIEDLSRAILS